MLCGNNLTEWFSWRVPQTRSPAHLPSDGTETEGNNEICSLRNALTGGDAMVAKVGLQIVVCWLVFLSPAIGPESTDSSLPLESSYLQWNKEFNMYLILIGIIFLLEACYQMYLCWLKMLFVPAASFIVIFLTVTSSTPQLPTWITQAQLFCFSAQSTTVMWTATESLQWLLWQQCERHITCRASGLQALLTVLVVGRDFTVLLITENTTHQLDLIKASPHKQSDYDANIQNAREHTFFF